MGKAMKSVPKRGTKKHPQCEHCGGQNHYTNTCPELAKQILKCLSKTCSSKKLTSMLSAGQLRLVDSYKPGKTGKRKGRRFFKGNPQAGKGEARLHKSDASKKSAECLGCMICFLAENIALQTTCEYMFSCLALLPSPGLQDDHWLRKTLVLLAQTLSSDDNRFLTPMPR